MNKVCLFLVFLMIGAMAVFAEDQPNRGIFIEGTALNPEQQAFFMDNFRMEAQASGYTVVENREQAGYTFRFDVSPNVILYDDGSIEPAPPDEAQYIVQITLFENSAGQDESPDRATDSTELVMFNYSFTNIDEMYHYNQYLFLNAAVYLPNPAVEEYHITVPEDDGWRNKRIYLRASADLPLSFFNLKPDGLFDERYVKKTIDPYDLMPVDHIFFTMPGLTLGAEVQILDWLCIEPAFQLKLGVPGDKDFLNMVLGVQLKFPIKLIQNLMIEPYAAFSYPLTISPAFTWFPLAAIGGGVQIGIKGGAHGSFFIDINYMHYLGDVLLVNPYTLYKPDDIHYQHYVIGLGIGYKIGFFSIR